MRRTREQTEKEWDELSEAVADSALRERYPLVWKLAAAETWRLAEMLDGVRPFTEV